jgi:hypothetical protein
MTVTTELLRVPMADQPEGAAWVPIAYDGEAGRQAYLDGQHSRYRLVMEGDRLVALLQPKGKAKP